MRKLIIAVLWILMILIGLFFGYLFLNPLFQNLSSFLKPHNITNINYAYTYYSMLSAIFGLYIGFLGLLLGAFYYVSRNKNEIKQKEREQQRARLQLFMDKLNDYDIIICKILSNFVTDENDLEYKRFESQKIIDDVNLMLEEGEKLLNFDDSDVKKILKINSFVDKSTLISHCSYSDFMQNKSNLIIEKYKYYDLITIGKKICYLRMV